MFNIITMKKCENIQFSLTGIVPYFNEQLTLKESVEKLNTVSILEKIILVDDSSTDKSKKIGRDLASSHDNIQYSRTPTNLGKGGAILHGLKGITTTHVIVHDADLEYNPNDIYEMFEKLNDYNYMVIGSRYLINKNLYNLNMSFALDKIERLSTFFFNKFFNTALTDIGSCYKLMPCDFLKNNNFYEKGFFIELEFLTKFINSGGVIIEVPINYSGRKASEGKKNNIFIMLNFLLKVFKISYKERRNIKHL